MALTRFKLASVIMLVASLVSFGGSTAFAQGNTLTVDDNRVECTNAEFTSIQAAVTAGPGDTIKVCPGTYMEQVTIPVGKDGLKLESTRKWEAIIKAPPVMTIPKAIVRVNGADDVRIRDFTIMGPFTDPGCAPALENHYGVRIDGGGSADLLRNHITEIRNVNPALLGCQDGIAILVGRNFENQVGTARIKDNLIDNYQKNGPTIDGPGSFAKIENNTIVGAGPVPYIAQNGIQIGRNASAEVKNNDVSGNVYDPIGPPSASSSGILIFGVNGGVEVSQNTVSTNDVGISMDSLSGVGVSRNTITDSTYDGISLCGDPYCGPATDNRIENNRIQNSQDNGIGLYGTDNNVITQNRSDNNGGDGVYVDEFSSGNTIENNRMDENVEHDAHDDSVGPETGGTANFWERNKCDTENRPGLCRN